MTTRTTKSLAFILCLLAGPVLGQAPIDIETDFAPGSHLRFADRVTNAQTAIYSEVLAAYDARITKDPFEPTPQVEKCRFIEVFAHSEEMYIESSSGDLEACQEQLRKGRHAEHPEVLLYDIEKSWGDDAGSKAEALIPRSRHWSPQQQAVLYELLSDKFHWNKPELSSQYAIQAVSLNPGSRVLLVAVERWIQLGAKDKARRLLLEAPESTWETVPRFSAAKLLVDMGDPKAAGEILRADKEAPGGNVMLARILAENGEIEAAREMYRRVIGGEFVLYDNRVEYFEFEREHGNREEAIAAYKQLRDQGFGADLLSRERLALFLAHPGAPWEGGDVWGFLLFFGLLLLAAIMPAAVIAPIHYRGLGRRIAGLEPDKPQPIWALRHAWHALAVFSIGGLISIYVFHAAFLELMLPWTKRGQTSATDFMLAREMLWTTLLTLLLILPLLRGRSLKSLLFGNWSVTKSILVGIGFAIALKVVAGIIGLGLQSAGALGTDTIRAMQGTHQLYGIVAMLLIFALAVPVIEELVFRGVLLEASRGQLTFLFAAVLQAALFALIHESWMDMPGLFLFGLVGAWLVKRSEGLLAPIVMHSTFNLIAALTVVGITSALNG